MTHHLLGMVKEFIAKLYDPTKNDSNYYSRIIVLFAFLLAVIVCITLCTANRHFLFPSQEYLSNPLENLLELPVSDQWFHGMSSRPGFEMILNLQDPSFSDMDITYQVSVDGGEFFSPHDTSQISDVPWVVSTYLGQEFCIQNGEQICWRPIQRDVAVTRQELLDGAPLPSWDLFSGDCAYVKIIIHANNEIVGYAVIAILLDADIPGCYTATVLEALCYPPVDNQMQSITDMYVQRQILSCITQNK